MSKIFYDKLIVLEEIEVEINQLGLEHDEKKELEHLIDEIIHHRIIDRVLSHLPPQHHEEFLQRFHAAPYDHTLIDYINARVDRRVEEVIHEEVQKLKAEILEDIKSSKKK